MANDKNVETNLLNEEAILAEINESEIRHKQLTDFTMMVEDWYQRQKNTIFGQLIGRVDEQLALANADLAAQEKFVKPEIPNEADRIKYRKTFHLELLRRLRFNTTAILVFLLIPVIFNALDALGVLSIFGVAIYPLIGSAIFVLTILFVTIRRMRTSAEKWPPRKMATWIALGVAIAAIVAFWPAIGLFAKIAVKSGFFPSAFQVILAFLGWFLIGFIRAILKYHFNYKRYFNRISDAHAELAWRSKGTLHVRSAIRRLELVRQQIEYWSTVIGYHLRTPWKLEDKDELENKWAASATTFPVSVRIAQARGAFGSAGADMQKAIALVIQDQSRNGWRVANLDLYRSNASRFNHLPYQISWDSIDADNPSAPNGSRKALLEFVKNEEFLLEHGIEKVSGLIPEVQNKILEAAELQVVAIGPNRGQATEQNWDQHLELSIGDPALGSPPLANFAFRPAHLNEGLNNAIVSLISGPQRLLNKVRAKAGNRIPASVELIDTHDLNARNIDLVLRIDLAGVEKPISANAIWLPKAGDHFRTGQTDLSRCQKCGRRDCVSITSGAECQGSGV
jgi:cytochrome c biogenesis protein CcdA